MKKWTISAVVYLLVIVGAYYAYASFSGENLEEANHGTKESQHDSNSSHNEGGEEGHAETDLEETETSGHEHSDHSEPTDSSEVLATVHEETGNLFITLKDDKNNPVSEIEVNHEKLMHLIVVSSDLTEYYHLHPESVEPGVFKTPHTLKNGEYKIFVDIKPKNLAYRVQPQSFILGNPDSEHGHQHLQPDATFVKEVGGHKVTLQASSLAANEDIQLKFDLNGEVPEQHLGALGHVVILDENAIEYLHVHPHEGNEPIFETKFTKPGIYKIWAEFKFAGEIFVFPYVVEIK
jgi:hypothetical protein